MQAQGGICGMMVHVWSSSRSSSGGGANGRSGTRRTSSWCSAPSERAKGSGWEAGGKRRAPHLTSDEASRSTLHRHVAKGEEGLLLWSLTDTAPLATGATSWLTHFSHLKIDKRALHTHTLREQERERERLLFLFAVPWVKYLWDPPFLVFFLPRPAEQG